MSFVEGLVMIVLIITAAMTIWVFLARPNRPNGRIVIERDDLSGKITHTLELDIDPYEIEKMRIVTFKVVDNQEIAD